MQNPEYFLEKETHKLFWDFEIQTDHLISARRPNLVIINKKKRTCWIVDFALPADNKVKLKENEKKDNYVDHSRELKKISMEHESEGDAYCNCCFWYNHQKIDISTEGTGKKDEWEPSKLQKYLDRPECWKESWRLEQTYCRSNSTGKKSGVKNSQEGKVITTVCIVK